MLRIFYKVAGEILEKKGEQFPEGDASIKITFELSGDNLKKVRLRFLNFLTRKFKSIWWMP